MVEGQGEGQACERCHTWRQRVWWLHCRIAQRWSLLRLPNGLNQVSSFRIICWQGSC